MSDRRDFAHRLLPGEDVGWLEIAVDQAALMRVIYGLGHSFEQRSGAPGRQGDEPAVPGFRHVPYNDIDAVRGAISPGTVAVLVEGIQGEGGILAATPEYLLGLRRLCDEKKLLLLLDGVQDGHFRTGRFQSFQRILESATAPSGPPGRVTGPKMQSGVG
jgi:Aminotransferase class-III